MQSKNNFFNAAVFAPETGAGAGAGNDGAPSAPPAQNAPHDASFGGLVTPGTNEAENTSQNSGGKAGMPPENNPENNAEGEKPAEKKTDALYKPEGLADDLVGESNQQTIDKLLAAQSVNHAPESPADYKFEFEGDVKDVFLDAENDPVLQGFSEVVHKHGLSNEVAQSLIQDVMKDWMEKGLVATPKSPDDFWTALASNGDSDKIKSGQIRVNAAAAFIQGLENSKVLTAEQKISLTNFATAAPENVAIIEALKSATSGHGIQTGGDSANIGTTKDDVLRMMKDARYQHGSHEFDQGYYDRVQKLGQGVFK